jgi:Putative zinc-finger
MNCCRPTLLGVPEADMSHPDEGQIHAWLDGALPAAAGDALEAHVASCTECAARVAEARGLVAAASRILTALDEVPAGVLPDASRGLPRAGRSPGSSRPRSLWRQPRIAAAAALLVVAAGTVSVMRATRGQPMADLSSPDAAAPVPAAAAREQGPAPASAAPVDRREARDEEKPVGRALATRPPASPPAPASAGASLAAAKAVPPSRRDAGVAREVAAPPAAAPPKAATPMRNEAAANQLMQLDSVAALKDSNAAKTRQALALSPERIRASEEARLRGELVVTTGSGRNADEPAVAISDAALARLAGCVRLEGTRQDARALLPDRVRLTMERQAPVNGRPAWRVTRDDSAGTPMTDWRWTVDGAAVLLFHFDGSTWQPVPAATASAPAPATTRVPCVRR